MSQSRPLATPRGQPEKQEIANNDKGKMVSLHFSAGKSTGTNAVDTA
jgi:hypothetical protein